MTEATPLRGLSSTEAAERLRLHGFNELPQPDRRNLIEIVLAVVREPMFAMLLCGGAIYLLLGEMTDAVVLSVFAAVTVSISIVQESRSEHVLNALRNLASPRALVVRDGERVRIPGRDVVTGDIVVLEEGDRIPADAIVLSGQDLFADESLLTGESLPVHKAPGQAEALTSSPGGDGAPFVFAGTLVTRGTGIARVTATAAQTEMGKIGQALHAITLEQPRLQRQLRWLVRDFAIAGSAAAVAVVVLFGVLRGSWLKAALAGIAIGMSVLPEEIPLILAVFMAMGAWRISKARVLTRRTTAIETLGSATVLCTDKTGTLTENRMRVQAIVSGRDLWRQEGSASLPGAFRNVLEAAYRASALQPADPMDRALVEAAEAFPVSTRVDAKAPSLLRTYGLSSQFFATTNVWAQADDPARIAYAKGAPEAVADVSDLTLEQRTEVLRITDDLAREGMRVLAVARAEVAAGRDLPDSQREFHFQLLGLIGFADPLRANVPAAVRECRSAGVRVVMITGDYPATARSIAAQAGVDAGAVLSGEELEMLSDEDLSEKMRTTSVFARIRPAQKLRLVEALKRDGEIVAMTGDGVNDAPAMKAAHIGIAMGGRGTDVAREAASLVLLDDDFSSIVAAIRLGRRIYDNLRKAIQYTIAVHIPIAGLAILPLLLGLPLMLAPIQIAFLEMIIDPACSIVFESEAEEDNIMRRRPRSPLAPMIARGTAIWALAQGLSALALVSFALLLGNRIGMPESDLRALVFTTLVIVNIGLILVNRSFGSSLATAILRPNRALWSLVAGVIALLTVALYWNPLQQLFHFGHLHWHDLLACLALGAATIALLEIGKRFAGRAESA